MPIQVVRDKDTLEYLACIFCDRCGERLTYLDSRAILTPNSKPSTFDVAFVHRHEGNSLCCDGKRRKAHGVQGQLMSTFFDGILDNLYMEQNAQEAFSQAEIMKMDEYA